MTLTIELPDEVRDRLAEYTAGRGLTPAEWVADMVC
jgi:predicted transcriptional regulator